MQNRFIRCLTLFAVHARLLRIRRYVLSSFIANATMTWGIAGINAMGVSAASRFTAVDQWGALSSRLVSLVRRIVVVAMLTNAEITFQRVRTVRVHVTVVQIKFTFVDH